MDVHSGQAAPQSRAWRQDGMSMLEVVIAAAILIVVLVPASSLLTSSSSFVTQSKAQVEATHLASGLLEQDRASAVSTSYWSGSTPSLVDTTATTQTVGALTFSMTQVGGWCFEVSGTWGTTSTGATETGYGVKATVTWQGGTQSVKLTTLISTPLFVTAPASSTSCPI